jgi:endonuclease/exonuclease/phosphatase family metal-dependent hydrolase
MPPPGARLRVATYNVHACVGTDRRHDPDRVASVVGELDADIVALQEFTYAASVAIETREPVELVALDGYECALGPTRQIATRCFGNALLTRHPIIEVHRLNLSLDGREPRGALAATLDVGGTPVHVLATHLGLRVRERQFQVQQLVAHLDSVQHSLLVVLGDINDWVPLRSVAHVLDRRLGTAPRLRSFPSSRPMLSLDRIWIRPAAALRDTFVHRSALARRASDHLPVVAEIDLDHATAAAASERERPSAIPTNETCKRN